MTKKPLLTVLLLSVLAANCGSTQQAAMQASSRWVDQPADSFFARHGPPKREHAIAGGGKVYSWETVAMPSGTRIQIACTADILTNARGIITEIRLQQDTIGHWNLSRCSEVFAQ